MFSDGVMNLIKKGIITNDNKNLHPGKLITSFCMGSQELYDFVNDNPFVNFLDVLFVNNPINISKIDRLVAINSCIEIDLTGQIVSDSIGDKI